jgi:peptidoglycan hydrolase-like protein with peptidoglycan-binding domain
MPTKYTVKRGDCISSIAFRSGFFAETIWKDSANEALKTERKDLNTLCEGDVITIPDLRLKEAQSPSQKRHRFRRRGVPARLRLRLMDHDRPLSGVSFLVDVDGVLSKGQTTTDGEIDVAISPIARLARLIVGEGDQKFEFELPLGCMRPLSELAGVQARLCNLGFECSDEAGRMGPKTEMALREFQKRNNLNATGEVDDTTRAKLKELHDAN